MDLRVRVANQSDLMLAYRWANDPLTREMNFKQGTVPLDTYMRLFSALLYDEDTLLLIVEGLEDHTWLPIAQVRFHIDGTMSLSIDNGYRGRHLATQVILAALEFAKSNFPINTAIAYMRHENIPSIKAFKRSGFSFNGEAIYKGHSCVEYIFRFD
ncbi:MAG TPA: GNAT family N-acetyltransferase [Anaerolineae bacterium]|jgi:RimJ/RimL family protein N-acetyltransferase|nr:GNAT family N-acetyltransferase [Anaerolineae bacterium]